MPIDSKEQRIPLDREKVLIISTRKSGNSLKTYGRVERVEGKYLVHTMFQDFNKCIKASTPPRITQKKVDEQAASINIEEVKQEAIAYYNSKLGEQNAKA